MRHTVSRAALRLTTAALALAAAHAARVPVRSYTTQDGLPRDHVDAIEIEPGGHILVGTAMGMTRFDGHSFRTWSEAEGLDGAVDTLHTERSGAIWAGGEFGLARLAVERPDRFEPVPAPSGMPGNVVVLFEDRDSTLWVGSNLGLHRIEPTPQGPRLGPPVAGIETEVDDIAQDPDGSLWVGTHLDLTRVDIRHDRVVARFTRGIAPGNNHVQAVMRDRSDRIWAGTREGLCLVARHATPDGDRPCESRYTMDDGLPSSWIWDVQQGSDGRLYAGTADGLAIGTQDASGALSWRHLGPREGVTGGAVHEVAQDPDGNIWLGTADRGLVKLVAGGLEAFGLDDGLTTVGVRSLAEDRRGNLYALGATPQDWVIQRLDGAAFTSVRPRLPAGVTYLGWGSQQITFPHSSGRFWVASGSGVLIYPAVPRLEDLAHTLPERTLTRRDGLAGNEVFRLFEDSRGDVWIGTIGGGGGNGFAIWRKEDGSVTVPARVPGLPEEAPTSFAEDPEGNVWIGFYSGGLARCVGGRVEALPHPEGLPVSFLTQILFDKSGRLWVSTYQGLARADQPNARPLHFRNYSMENGLASRDVHAFAEDRSGRLWLGTSNGITRLDPETGRMRRYTTADGLPASVVGSVHCDRTGRLWFGTRDGLATLMPGEDPQPAPPPVLLEAIEVAGRPRRLPPLGLDRIAGLTLPAGQERVRIDFRSVGYRAGDIVSFQYRLDESPDWSPASTQRSVIFDRLAPGRHRFEVRAVDLEGLTSVRPASVEFRVEPPFWRTWWFGTLALGSLAAAALLLHRQRVARLVALERMRIRIATDLHDEVGAGLSEIALISELWARQGTAAPAGDGAPGRIAATSRRLVDSMSDIVWAINPEKDHVFSLSQRMRRFATTLLRSAGIALRFESIDESQDRALDGDARRELLLAFQEIIHNAVKHASCTLVEVRLAVDGGELSLQVRDDGRGFDPAGVEEQTGLSSLRQRAARLDGRCIVQSAPGSGTQVTLRVPLARRRRGSSAARSSPPGEGPGPSPDDKIPA